jgi:hypothetical protein
MKINGKLTLLFNSDGLYLEIDDDDSGIRIITARLNKNQTCDVLARVGYTKMESVEFTDNSSNIGKKLELNTIVVPLGVGRYTINKEETKVIAEKYIKENYGEWVLWDTFSSQGSYFSKDGIDYARASIRRWV